ncbi:SGNH/GDSL hydrolase family protein [Lactobacillus kefiranofaciens subsp. kefirgranum]|uniref:SGNH/GDSL hydrolase family protein n=1 Tax=Lactobacillus kefiranofaciens TaxID=267818 RepID=UPI0006F0A280|nr:SGNH/GDSL hydrolase family protein [Lactobacillus kefiranofaciens]KRL29201.1 acyl-coa thioesterase [Lactobacillus kefiranofaciens subsp. kefirgranum DSM 10550 = JCM 8572]MCJ2171482.1 SGNH/GDSL hydrolase family protein [Lactobacillus kefiranofaciens]MCP9330208.1 SGNH/GDSL hydrolase family protein [Lactobacillus kefiranofaciens]MDF4141813.1 SGNH/GDSL hydrolase family protein [Lactobacillus kefiranofaciens]PAK99019.1 acyl-CoA thioesterase [Lactobacillus kefiranofaciens]
MSNETFLIPIRQNNDLSDIALNELRMDLDEHPLHQRIYADLAYLSGNNRKYSLNKVETINSPLRNKKILFLGSSVTFGFGALGESFVDYLWKKDGIAAIKDAENGTTLVDQATYNAGDSYVARFNKELKETNPDLFVLQLSTNDARQGKKLGKISQNDVFDTQTIIGAMEYIISTAKSKWHCPILIYTNPYFESELYEKMVNSGHQLAQKWNIEILDLYNNPKLKKQASLYMADEIHPTRAGYLKQWLPLFEDKIIQILVEKSLNLKT